MGKVNNSLANCQLIDYLTPIVNPFSEKKFFFVYYWYISETLLTDTDRYDDRQFIIRFQLFYRELMIYPAANIIHYLRSISMHHHTCMLTRLGDVTDWPSVADWLLVSVIQMEIERHNKSFDEILKSWYKLWILNA